MENIIKENILKDIEKVKQVFAILGFSESQCEQHLVKIEDVLTAKVLTLMLESKGFQKQENNNDDKIIEFVRQNFTSAEAKTIVEKESKEFFRNYFDTILNDVEEEKLVKINAIITA